MLLDTTYSNLILENFGSTVSSLFDFSNVLAFVNYNLTFDFVSNLLNMLELWPTEAQKKELFYFLPAAFYSSNSYMEVVGRVSQYFPFLYAVDAVSAYYLRHIFMWTYLNSCSTVTTVVHSNLYVYCYFDTIYDLVSNKWGYLFISYWLLYFVTSLMKVRYQYGFNFYFTYFKALSDLGEQEYGSYDDYKFFVFFLVQMFVWYCWVLFLGYCFCLYSESKLMLLTISIMLTILSIPVRLLWDFGLAFGMYVRGAASSSNLVVEAFFDIIGVIIIFTRFIVQNIRFLLVFAAFFELFEWTVGSFDFTYFKQAFSQKSILDALFITSSDLFTHFLTLIKGSFVYLYHLLHLIIITFMQIGVFLMVSFWLFFFLYTSFFKVTVDSYFQVVRTK